MTADRVYRAGHRGARGSRRAPALRRRSVRLACRRRVPHGAGPPERDAVASATLKSPKRSVSLVIEGPDGLLLVRRPDDDESLPGVWGLPAVSLAPGESEEDARAPRRPREAGRGGGARCGRVGGEAGMTDWTARDLGRRAGGASARCEHAVRGPALGRARRTGARRPRRARSAAARAAARPRSRLESVSTRPGVLAQGSLATGPGGGELARRALRGPRRGRAARRRRGGGAARARLARARRARHAAGRWFEADGERLRSSFSRCAGRCACSSDASDSLTALCVVRTEDGRWLAGRRAGWVSTWAEPLGARRRRSGRPRREPRRHAHARASGGVAARAGRLSVEALLALPERDDHAGRARDGRRTAASPCPTREHDEWAWWPADIDRWPAEADERLKLMAALLGS